jgi:hypothetical protein
VQPKVVVHGIALGIEEKAGKAALKVTWPAAPAQALRVKSASSEPPKPRCGLLP